MERRRRQEMFLKKVFRENAYAKEAFDSLVELGCDRNMLKGWLLKISEALAMLQSRGSETRRSLAAWDFMVGGLSEGGLKTFLFRLLWVGQTIKELDQTQLSKYMKLMPALDGHELRLRLEGSMF